MFNTTINVTVDTAQGVRALQQLSGAVGTFDRSLSRADNKLREFERGIGSFRRAILGLQSALLGFGAMNLVRDLIRVNLEFERVRFALLAGANSAEAAAADFRWLREETQKLGLPLNKVGLEYAKLTANAKGTALQGEPVRQVFTSVSKAAQALGLDISSTQRIFMALSQMLSKGRVQAEEARQQFGEHLPGGFKALAKAAGFDAVTGLGKFQEALRKGQVDAIEMLTNLPKVLDEMFGPAFEAALISSPQMAINRFKAMFANLAYDIGQGGFMREFVGMLRDIENTLSSDQGRKEIERLTVALSELMRVVRGLTNFILNNFTEVVAVVSGLASGALILGLKGLFGWFSKIAGASGSLAGALRNPWMLGAAAIAGATYAVMRFGGETITVGQHSAKGLDWIRAAFALVSESASEAIKRLRDFVEKTPLLRNLATVVQQLGTAFQTIAQGALRGFLLALESVRPAIQPLVDLKDRVLRDLGVLVYTVWTGIQGIASSASSWAGTVAATLAVFGQQLGAAFGNLGKALAHAFSTALDIIEPLVVGFLKWLNETFGDNGAINFWKVLGAVAIIALNLIVGAINFLAAAIEFAMDLVDVLADALGPLFTSFGRLVEDLFKHMTNGLKSSTPLWDAMRGIIWLAYQLIKGLIEFTVGFFSLVARTLAPVIDGLRMALNGIITAVMGIWTAVTDAFGSWANEHGPAVAGAVAQVGSEVNDSRSKVIKLADVIVGTFVTAVQVVGAFIEVVGAAISALVQLAQRAYEVGKNIGTMFEGFFTFNFEKMYTAAEGLKAAVTEPLKNIDWKGIAEDLNRDVSQNFRIVSSAVADGARAGAAFEEFANSVTTGLTTVNQTSIEAMQDQTAAAAADAGAATANSYFDSLMNTWGQRAQGMTAAADAERARIKAEQDALAKAQAEAWARDNAGVDRTLRPEQLDSGGGGGRSRKSPAEKAAELIAEMKAKRINDIDLTADIALNPNRDPMEAKAFEAAQSALRRADFNVSVGQALRGDAGATAKQLAQVAIEGSQAAQMLDRFQKAQAKIGENALMVKALDDQIALTRDLSVSSGEYQARLAAQNALKEADLDVTYAQAMAADENSSAQLRMAKALATSAYELEKHNQEAEAAVRIASQLRAYQQAGNELALFTAALREGQAALDRTAAEVAAQQAVMDAYGDEVFDATRLNDANTASLYRMAEAYAKMGGSLESVIRLMRELKYDSQAITDPLGAERQRILDDAASKRTQLEGYMDAATIKYEQDMDAAMGQAAYDPAGAAAAIDRAVQEYNAARTKFEEAIANLENVTQYEIMKRSNNWLDAMKVAIVEFGKDAENIGGKIQDIFSSAFDGMADELTKFVMTGKADFRSLALSIIADIQKMIIKWLMWQAIKAAASAVGIPIPFANGGVMSSSGPVPSDGALAAMNYAKGGVMTEFGNVALRKYGRGGIARTPQLALFGEGSGSEAYVPLPDGRSIPVTLNLENYHDSSRYGGGASGPTTVNIDTTVIVEGGSNGVNPNDPQANEKMAESLGRRINAELRSQVISIIADELRPGGTFNKMGSNRSRF